MLGMPEVEAFRPATAAMDDASRNRLSRGIIK